MILNLFLGWGRFWGRRHLVSHFGIWKSKHNPDRVKALLRFPSYSVLSALKKHRTCRALLKPNLCYNMQLYEMTSAHNPSMQALKLISILEASPGHSRPVSNPRVLIWHHAYSTHFGVALVSWMWTVCSSAFVAWLWTPKEQCPNGLLMPHPVPGRRESLDLQDCFRLLEFCCSSRS